MPTKTAVSQLTNLQYGQKQNLEQAVAQTPAQPQAPPAPSGGAAPPSGTAPAQAAPVLPGSMGAFTRPTERPNEPITHGLPTGPGAGPEILGGTPSTLVDYLKQLANSPYASQDVQRLLASVQPGGH